MVAVDHVEYVKKDTLVKTVNVSVPQIAQLVIVERAKIIAVNVPVLQEQLVWIINVLRLYVPQIAHPTIVEKKLNAGQYVLINVLQGQLVARIINVFL